AEPENGAGEDVGVGGADAQALEGQHHQQAQPRYRKAAVIQAARVEQGDDKHGDNVIDNRQGQQKDPHVGRDGSTQQRQQAYRKGDIGGGGDGPAMLPDDVVVQAEVEQGRQDHAAGGGCDGQAGLAQAG